ncbi:MAG: hypothetical protein V1871_07335 [Planctomycetota bacterium]
MTEKLRGGCAGARGKALWDAGDFAGAAMWFREALRADPSQGAWRTNLVAALQRIIDPLVRARRCGEAKGPIDEGLSLAPGDEFLLEARRFCAAR